MRPRVSDGRLNVLLDGIEGLVVNGPKLTGPANRPSAQAQLMPKLPVDARKAERDRLDGGLADHDVDQAVGAGQRDTVKRRLGTCSSIAANRRSATTTAPSKAAITDSSSWKPPRDVPSPDRTSGPPRRFSARSTTESLGEPTSAWATSARPRPA